MRRISLQLPIVVLVTLLAGCPRPKDGDGSTDSGAERGTTETGEPEPPSK
jgi:hypothetical protein